MVDQPQHNPWEAELQAEALREEYTKRGETYPGSDPIDPPAATTETEPAATLPAEPEAARSAAAVSQLSDDEQEQLAREFAAKFQAQTTDSRSISERLAAWLSTNEGRVVVIAVITCVALLLIGQWLSTMASSKLPAGP